ELAVDAGDERLGLVGRGLGDLAATGLVGLVGLAALAVRLLVRGLLLAGLAARSEEQRGGQQTRNHERAHGRQATRYRPRLSCEGLHECSLAPRPPTETAAPCSGSAKHRRIELDADRGV